MVAAIAHYASIPVRADVPLALPRKALAAALALIGKSTDRRSSIPVLADLLLTCHEGRQRIQATDLNCSVTYLAPSAGAPVHGVTVNAKLLADMVKSATGDTVTLTKSGAGITVGSNGSDATILGTSRDRDYPKIPELPEMGARINAEALADGVEACLHAVSKDETRFHLNGVLVEGKGNLHRLVATDGHRLIKVFTFCDTVNGTGILPAPAAAILVKLLRLGEVCKARIEKHLFHVACVAADGAAWEATFKMIDAQYPPYEQVIPTDYSKLVTVERKPLIAAMKRAKALCSQTRGAKLSVAAGKLTITSDHPDHGSTSESLKAESQWVEEGGAMAFGLNAGYLVEALEEIACDHVTLAFGDELGPVEVRGTDDQVEYAVDAARQIEVVMPMRI